MNRLISAASSLGDGFLPHGVCYLWQPALLWTHVISDFMIFLAYLTISIGLLYFVRRRHDLEFRFLFVFFAVFILACGLTHLAGVANVWVPDCWTSAWIKVVTAIVSVVTAIVLWPLIPKALALPSPSQLRELNEELEAISERLVVTQERSRAAIARELHDELGSLLTALSIDLGRIERGLGAGAAQTAVISARALVNEATQIKRRVIETLRPSILDNLGLGAALQWLGNDFAARSGLGVETVVPAEDLALNGSLAIDLFRIAQESLTNILKHARATRVDIKLEQSAGKVTLIIHDDGDGLSEATALKKTSHGISGMRYRARRWSGLFAIDSSPAAGTTVRVIVPHVGASDEDFQGDATFSPV